MGLTDPLALLEASSLDPGQQALIAGANAVDLFDLQTPHT
jgi:hypothetical protein